jgi:hypothetical protein
MAAIESVYNTTPLTNRAPFSIPISYVVLPSTSSDSLDGYDNGIRHGENRNKGRGAPNREVAAYEG